MSKVEVIEIDDSSSSDEEKPRTRRFGQSSEQAADNDDENNDNDDNDEDDNNGSTQNPDVKPSNITLPMKIDNLLTQYERFSDKLKSIQHLMNPEQLERWEQLSQPRVITPLEDRAPYWEAVAAGSARRKPVYRRKKPRRRRTTNRSAPRAAQQRTVKTEARPSSSRANLTKALSTLKKKAGVKIKKES